jgi:hypothetical protein
LQNSTKDLRENILVSTILLMSSSCTKGFTQGAASRWCHQCDTSAASRGPQTKGRGLMQQFYVGTPFGRIAIFIAGPFPEIESKSIRPDCYGLLHQVVRGLRHPTQDASTVTDALATNFYCRFGVPSTATRAGTSSVD